MRVWLSYLLPIALCAIAAGLLNQDGWLLLRYQSDLWQSGEFWRLLSGHLLHLNWNHTLMNLLALILITQIFSGRTPLRWWLDTLLGAFIVSLGLLWLSPDVGWYVGLSGIAHGLFVAALLERLPLQPRSSLLLLVAIAGKLLWEQLYGALPLVAGSTPMPVIVDAHLYGAVSGVLSSLLYLLSRHIR